MENETPTQAKAVNHGSPPFTVAANRARLEALALGPATEPALPTTITELSKLARPFIPEDQPAPRVPLYPDWVERLVQLNADPKIPVVIRVNGVGISFHAVAVDRVGSRFCLLIAGEMSCELPLSFNVELVIGEETHEVAYLGQWHRFSCLPFYVVSFCERKMATPPSPKL